MKNPLIQAVREHDYLALRQLLAEGGEPDVRDEFGETPLTWAAHLGYTSVVKDLLAANADRETQGNMLNATPLLLAARAGHRGIVALLAPLAELDARTPQGATALMLAIEKPYDHPKSAARIQSILKILIDSEADLDLQDEFGNTALMWAVKMENPGAIQRLLFAGANRDLKNLEGQTALDIADTAGKQELVDLLNNQIENESETA